ncbi:MAG: DUF1080 domain-containing protein [Candidatus Brocadiia bacterium]
MARWLMLLSGGLMVLGALPAQAAEGEKKVLFDGTDLAHWKCKPNGWHIDDEGNLAWKKGCGYIWTKDSFADFILRLEFKVSKGCNSGIFIRANPRSPVQHGLEVQVLDSHGRKPNRTCCGAIYHACAPTRQAVKPAGEWNAIVIACKDNEIDVTLNGEHIVDMDLDRWDEAGKNPDGSKNKYKRPLKDFPREGHIGFQDHGKPVWFRNVTIEVLEDEK